MYSGVLEKKYETQQKCSVIRKNNKIDIKRRLTTSQENYKQITMLNILEVNARQGIALQLPYKTDVLRERNGYNV